ncbi:MAG: hypothetical protein HC794_01210 [Nitrospiraceae bacterium]|nr:hypothetical protein [Nitrospiraceae bacterium]
MLLELSVGERELLSTLLNAIFQMLCQFGEISVGLGIVDGGCNMAGNR